MFYLVCTHGVDQGLVAELSGAVYIMGRAADCDIVISDDKASRRHCRLETTGSRLMVEDLNSTNGVKYHGKRVKGTRLRMSNGEVFGIGKDRFEFTDSPPDRVAEAARDVVAGLSTKGHGSVVEQTFIEAVATEKKRKSKRFSIFDIFRRK